MKMFCHNDREFSFCGASHTFFLWCVEDREMQFSFRCGMRASPSQVDPLAALCISQHHRDYGEMQKIFFLPRNTFFALNFFAPSFHSF